MRQVPLEVRELSVGFRGETLFRGLSVTVSPGEVVALTGPSGSGKSSVLSCCLGLLAPLEGWAAVCGEKITAIKRDKQARVRRELIGICYQDPHLLPELSVAENVAVTLLFDGAPHEEALAAAERSLDAVGLQGHGSKRIDQISGGQAQRASLARALVRPGVRLLIADEPTASLDPQTAISTAELILSRVREQNIAALIATHDNRVAERCDRVVDLREWSDA